MTATARPFLMFQDGVAQSALDLYFSTLPDIRIVRVEQYAQCERVSWQLNFAA